MWGLFFKCIDMTLSGGTRSSTSLEWKMRYVVPAIIVVLAFSITSVHADFSMSGTRTNVNDALDRIDLFMTNNGGNSGTNTVAMQLGGYGIPSLGNLQANSLWKLANVSTGKPDAFNNFDTTLASGVRLTTDPTQHLLAYYTPGSWGNSDYVGIRDWGLTWVTKLRAETLNNGLNYKFASLLVDKGAGMHFDILTGGTIGDVFALAYDIPPIQTADAPSLVGVGSFLAGTSGTNTYFVSASSTSTLLSQSLLAVPADAPAVSLQLVGDLQRARDFGATVVPENGGLRVSFSPSADLVGQAYNLSFRATDTLTGASSVKTLTLTVVPGAVPEPTAVCAFLSVGVTWLLGRRRPRSSSRVTVA